MSHMCISTCSFPLQSSAHGSHTVQCVRCLVAMQYQLYFVNVSLVHLNFHKFSSFISIAPTAKRIDYFCLVEIDFFIDQNKQKTIILI